MCSDLFLLDATNKTSSIDNPVAMASPLSPLQDVGDLISLTVTPDAWLFSIFPSMWVLCFSQEQVHLSPTNVDTLPANGLPFQNKALLTYSESWTDYGLTTCAQQGISKR